MIWPVIALLGLLALAAGCGPAVRVVTATPSPAPGATATADAPATAGATATPTGTPTASPSPTPAATPTPRPLGVWFAPGVPEAVRGAFDALLAGGDYRAVANPMAADLRVDLEGGNAPIGALWVYAVVAPFPTLTDALAWEDILRFWRGAPDALAYIANSGAPPTLVVTVDVLATLTALLGPPDPSAPVQIVEGGAALSTAWAQCAASWSVVPFDALRPEWKVLAVDGVNLLDRAAELDGYPLAVGVGLHGPADAVDAVGRALAAQGAWRVTNRDPARMTVLAMTGVTALARVTARRMDEVDVTYPAGDILPVLEQADILHVSNEVSFSPDCQPDYRWASMSFCARAAYFDLLTHIGVDVVELTGNHVNDYGTAGLDYSLGLFEAAGMGVFGGGRNLEAARAPWRTEHNGNTFAFVGCNPVGPPNAYATADRPGAAPCDYGALRRQIEALAGEVDVVVVTQQYWEFDHANPTPQQVEDFSSLARAGADIVSGSQAHQPQGFAFVDGRFVHYGLGNLFFDQMQAVNLREMFIDLHVIYEGRHISTALFTGMLEDFARPRPMTPDERRDFLGRLFDAPPLCAAP